jgi:hypothetical protein
MIEVFAAGLLVAALVFFSVEHAIMKLSRVCDTELYELVKHTSNAVDKIYALEKNLDRSLSLGFSYTMLHNEFQNCRGTIMQAPCVICISERFSQEATDMFEEIVGAQRPSLRALRVRYDDHWPLQDIKRCSPAQDSFVFWSPDSLQAGYYSLSVETPE